MHLRARNICRLAVAFGVALAVSCPFLNEQRKSIEYRIPAGYRGWVRIEYANPKCISSRRDEKFVLEISEAGVACTSDDYESGEAVDRYRFIDARGDSVASSSAAAVRNGQFTRCTDASGRTQQYESFFVGTKTEVSAQSPFEPCTGPPHRARVGSWPHASTATASVGRTWPVPRE